MKLGTKGVDSTKVGDKSGQEGLDKLSRGSTVKPLQKVRVPIQMGRELLELVEAQWKCHYRRPMLRGYNERPGRLAESYNNLKHAGHGRTKQYRREMKGLDLVSGSVWKKPQRQ